MKRLLLLLVSLTFIPMTAQAEIKLVDGKLSVGGHLRFRYEFKNDTDFGVGTDPNDTRSYFFARLRPYIKVTPDPKLDIYLEPQLTAGWGKWAGLGESQNDFKASLHQGFIEYRATDHFSVKGGRHELAYGDQLLLGPLNWHNISRSFEGVTFRVNGEKYWIDLLWALVDDTEASAVQASPNISGDAHLAGVYSSLNLGKFFKELDFYALYRVDKSGVAPTLHNYVTAGARLKSKPNNWDYRAEVTGQIGKQQGFDQRDYQVDAEVGRTWEKLASFRTGLGLFASSRNFNQLFPTGHAWLGDLDLFGRRNVMGGVARFSLKPVEKVKLNFAAYTFLRTKTNAGLASIPAASGPRIAAGGGIGGAGTSNSRLAGEEFDLTVSYQIAKFLNISAGASTFIPMGFIKDNVGDDWPVFGWLQTTGSF